MELLKKAEEAMEMELCDHCLGRLFAQLGHGLTNDERGRALRVYSAMYRTEGENRQTVSTEPETCTICRGLCTEFDKFASIIMEAFADIEFQTFLVGSRIDPEIEENEERAWTDLDITTSSPIKTEVNREVGKRVDALLEAEVDLEMPDVKAILDTRFDTVDIEVSPIFIYGRYRKLSRGIPQTRWNCNHCWGTGCSHCDNTGKMYQTSVEEIIEKPLLEMTEGEKGTLHGMGREDIDVLMLGSGRPFVMEVTNPIRRDIDLEELASKVNDDGRVEIDSLRYSVRGEVQEIKSERVEKSYRVKLLLSEEVDRGRFKKVMESLMGITLSQRTPNRVSHRRADKIRKRKIRDLGLISMDKKEVEILLRCEAGTYVKEFVHGDQGRTKPSLTSELDMRCEVLSLDVSDVHYEEKEVVK